MDTKKFNNRLSLDSENDSGKTDCRMTSEKRKLSISHPQSPTKRQRSDRGPPEVPVQDVTARGNKRKASTGGETPSKRQRSVNDTDEPTKVSVEDVRETGSKEEASAEQLPGNQTPKTTGRENGCEDSPSSSSPSTSQNNDGSTSFSDTSRAIFEALYTELDRLGKGGFGSVYAGYRKTDHLPVAIKHIAKHGVKSQPMVFSGRTDMIPEEVLLMLKATGGLQPVGKSAVVSLLDWYDLDQEVLLIMERPVPSEDMRNYLDDGPLTEDQAKNIMKQLVEAATEMLSVGVFHRDIKPENILVETGSDVPRVRIIDFGCGCFVQTGPYSSYSGTPAYVPPEFFRHGTYQAGPTTVWQLGALLYEMLHGSREFSTSKVLRREIKISKELSQDCKNLLRMCLAVNPKQRATLEQIQLHPWFK